MFCVIFTKCEYVIGEEPTGYEFPTTDSEEFIKSCINLEFLVLGLASGDNNAVGPFSSAIEHCEHFSELYVGGGREYIYFCRWGQLLMSEEYPYDTVGDIILDYRTSNL